MESEAKPLPLTLSAPEQSFSPYLLAIEREAEGYLSEIDRVMSRVTPQMSSVFHAMHRIVEIKNTSNKRSYWWIEFLIEFKSNYAIPDDITVPLHASARKMAWNTAKKCSEHYDYLHGFIKTFLTSLLASDLSEKCGLIDTYARDHPGEDISWLVLRVFPELQQRDRDVTYQGAGLVAGSSEGSLSDEAKGQALQSPYRQQNGRSALSLPSEAPELYQGLRGPESPPEFVKRVYSEFLGQITRADIRRLDSKLYSAIDNWSRKNEWPADVDLPTLKEQNSRWVERVTQDTDSELSLREARRLEGALRRRKGHQAP